MKKKGDPRFESLETIVAGVGDCYWSNLPGFISNPTTSGYIILYLYLFYILYMYSSSFGLINSTIAKIMYRFLSYFCSITYIALLYYSLLFVYIKSIMHLCFNGSAQYSIGYPIPIILGNNILWAITVIY